MADAPEAPEAPPLVLIENPLMGMWPIPVEQAAQNNPIFAGIQGIVGLQPQLELNLYQDFVLTDDETHNETIRKNRRILKNAIYRVFQGANIPILRFLERDQKFGENTQEVLVQLNRSRFMRTNPALKRFGRFEPKVEFLFGSPSGIPIHERFYLVDVNPDRFLELVKVLDDVLLQQYWMREKSFTTAKNVKNKGRNIIRRRIVRKIMEQKVGDPLFARQISQFGTTLPPTEGWRAPQSPVNANLAAIEPNLFEGGRQRKTRRQQKKKKTRKQRA